MADDERMDGYFEGHQFRDCGEHQTVGPYKAWCFECSEWCFPQLELGCKGCRIPYLQAEIERLRHERDVYAGNDYRNMPFAAKQTALEQNELARARVGHELFRWSAKEQSADETLKAIEVILEDIVDQQQDNEQRDGAP